MVFTLYNRLHNRLYNWLYEHSRLYMYNRLDKLRKSAQPSGLSGPASTYCDSKMYINTPIMTISHLKPPEKVA